MIQRLKNRLLQKYLNWRLGRISSPNQIHDFSRELSRVKHILLILPPDLTIEDVMTSFVKKLYDVFGDEIRISTFEKRTFRQEDSTWLGLPKKEYLQIFQSEGIDLVIDLNQEEDAFCTYICALLNAPVKVNLAAGRFDHIYNLHIRSPHAKQFDEMLETLIRYFKTLLGKT